MKQTFFLFCVIFPNLSPSFHIVCFYPISFYFCQTRYLFSVFIYNLLYPLATEFYLTLLLLLLRYEVPVNIIVLSFFGFKNKIIICHTPVFRYGASFSSIFSWKDILWNLFIKWRQVAAMDLDLKQTQNIFVSTQSPWNIAAFSFSQIWLKI